jgi:hypothetical protein
MAHAYTPGLKVARSCVVRRERILPLKGEVLVRTGDHVTADQVVARTELPGDVEIINMAHELAAEPKEIAGKMTLGEGDPVTTGQTLAASVGLFGLFRKSVLAPCDGTIETISAVTGKVIVRKPPVPVEVRAYVSGTVVAVRESEGVTVETPAAFVQGIVGIGGETHGELAVLAPSADAELGPSDIDESTAGQILVVGRLAGIDLLNRARDVGAQAVIAGGINDYALETFLGYPLGVAITGHETLGLTVVITEGFGAIPIADRTFDLLRAHVGEAASVNGATQIRAGVIRPEIVIPLHGEAAVAEEEAGVLTIGDTVRIIREPYFGKLAEVTALPPELTLIPTEAHVRVLGARLEDGSELTIPRANVEVIVG